MLRIAIICLFCLGFVKADAQRFQADIQCGIVGSQVSGDDLSGFDKAGLLAGIGIRTEVKNKFSFGFKMLYLQKGSRKPSKLDQGDPSYYLLQLNYIEFPLQFRYQVNKKLYVEIGPSVGCLLKHKEQDQDGELYGRTPFNSSDLSLNGAVAYSLNQQFDVRFEAWQSVIPIREHSNGNTYRLNQGQYNSVIALSLQYTFKSQHH